MSVPQQGQETRGSILPSSSPGGIGFLGSPYNPADAMLTPPQIGVTVGDSMSDVMNAVKGVAFYADQIGFGAPSSGFTQGMPLKPLGVNYFTKTGASCSNGADMYSYFQGITQGDALGSHLKDVMAQMGLPPLQGLAPGMIEDAESALNPQPLLNALFGSGYARCKQVTLPVGDAYGRIQGDDGQYWIDQPDTATKKSDGLYYQTRWIQETDAQGNPINITKDEWDADPKAYNPDGTPIKGSASEGFVNKLTSTPAIITAGLLCLLAYGTLRRAS